MTDETLQGILAELTDLVGIAKTLRIVERWGGTRLYVPAQPPDDHALVEAVGRQAANAIASAYAGERLEVPRAVALMRELRNREMRAAAAEGATQPELARQYRLTQRQIRTILGADDAPLGADVDVRQASLL